MKPFWLKCFFICFLSQQVFAQDNYEIQVYDSKLVEKGCTMFELHSNYTINGFQDTINGMLPTRHALHETIEITHGFKPWLEIGFYQFLSRNDNSKPAYVGNHIRPRVSLPEAVGCPVGLSLSVEAGYQVRQYATDSWTLEIRPIIDKNFGKLYVGLNPTVDYSLAGLNHTRGAFFSPNAKISYQICRKIRIGLEYYNSSGPFRHFDAFGQQPHQLALAFDIDFSPDWELNFGYVRGLTGNVEQDIFKLIIGRRIGKMRHG
jgi:hypothetical protein